MRIGRNQYPVGRIVVGVLGYGTPGPIDSRIKVLEPEVDMGNSGHRFVGVTWVQSYDAVKNALGLINAA
jgi:hypothetical protein